MLKNIFFHQNSVFLLFLPHKRAGSLTFSRELPAAREHVKLAVDAYIGRKSERHHPKEHGVTEEQQYLQHPRDDRPLGIYFATKPTGGYNIYGERIDNELRHAGVEPRVCKNGECRQYRQNDEPSRRAGLLILVLIRCFHTTRYIKFFTQSASTPNGLPLFYGRIALSLHYYKAMSSVTKVIKR
jgi:hypothetical protein